MARQRNAKVYSEYAAWWSTPERLRIAYNLPRSDKEFAEVKGVADRTLRRWREDEEFQALTEQYAIDFADQEPGATVSAVGRDRPRDHGKTKAQRRPTVGEVGDPVGEGLSDTEREYEQIKDTIVRSAKDGDPRSVELYMKTWGKSLVEAELREGSEFAEMSDQQLVDEVVDLLGEESLADGLARLASR